MNNRKTFFAFIIATLLAGCASTPTRINGLNLENSGLTSDIELNGVLISHGDKFVLDKAFQIPTVPSVSLADIPTAPWDFSVSFADIPTGPWEFNGSTLFPEFNSSSITCADSDKKPWREDCDRYNQLKGPFIYIECKTRFIVPKSSITYSQRWNEIEREKTKIEREKTKVDDEYSTGEIIGGVVVTAAAGAFIVYMSPALIAEVGLNELGVCNDSERRVWFDHDEFFDTVKKAVINDYGSINAYVTDIRQATMAYNTLTNIDNDKRGGIESLILEWESSIDKLLPENDSMDNYRIRYSPYTLVKIPRKEDWSRKRAVIESDILSHYAEQLTSINRQMDSYNKSLKQRYGININLSTEVK